MAIRKLRKQMKPLILLFVTAFILTMLGGVVAYVYSFKVSKEQRVALKLNGKDVDYTKMERAFSMGLDSYKRNYGDKIDTESLKMMIFNNVIEQELLLQDVSKLKVKVSSSAVEEQYENIESGFGDKDQFKRALQAQGYTRDTLKKEIKNSLLVEEVRKKIEEQAKVTDEEVEAYYNENKYGVYLNKVFEDEKVAIKEKLENVEKSKIYNSYVESLMKTAKIEKIKDIYAPYQYKIEITEEGFEFSNVEVSNRVMLQKLYGVTDEEEAKKNALDSFKSEIKIAKKAIEKGAKPNKDLAATDQLNDLREQLEKILTVETKVEEKDIMFYFAENKTKYDIQEEAEIELIQFDLVATDEDKAEAKAKAEEILAKIKEQVKGINDFAELAKEYSEGPSAPYGGDLGWFGKGRMVQEFETAAFAAEKGTLIPDLIKTQFGYHIIFVEDKKEENGEELVKASHILIQEQAGEATKQEVVTKANDVMAKLVGGEIKLEDAVKDYSNLKDSKITKIARGGYLPGIGFDKEFSEAIFDSELNKYTVYSGSKVILFNKTKYVPFEEAVYENVKDRVKYEYLKEKINKEILELM